MKFRSSILESENLWYSNMLLDMNDEWHSQGGSIELPVFLLLISRVIKLDFLYFAQEDFAVGVVERIPILQVFAIRHHGDRFTSWAIQFWLVVCDRKPFALYVGLHPKVGEEEEEEDTIHPDQVDPKGNLVVTSLHEVVLADVNGDQNKLRL